MGILVTLAILWLALILSIVVNCTKKWSCKCVPSVNVRIAIPDFHAQCLRCQAMFVHAT